MARTSELVHRLAEEVSARYCRFTRLFAYSYTPTLRLGRLLEVYDLHLLRQLNENAYTPYTPYTPTLTSLILHACSYTPTLTRLLLGWGACWKSMTCTSCASSMRTPLAFRRTSIFTTRATPPPVRLQQVFF